MSERLAHVRQRPGPAILAVAAGVAIGFLVALATAGGDASPARSATVIELAGMDGRRAAVVPATEAESEGTAPATNAGAPPATGTGTTTAGQAGMRSALARAVAAAEHYGGTAEAAVWLDGWPAPVVVGGGAPMRMWSMSKAVTAVAVMEATSGRPSGELAQALGQALTLSDNCAQRRVIVGLQTLERGVEQARTAFEGVLGRANAHATLSSPPSAPETQCVAYLQQHAGGVGNPLQPAYQYGTATWTVTDAIRFAHALGSGAYGAAGDGVLGYLSRPKGVSAEAGPGGFTADVAWGAGRAFARWHPAYKAGWGGADRGNFLVGQIAVVRVGGRTAAVAAMYHPSRQPTSDDPGQVDAAVALEALLDDVAKELARTQGAG